MICLKDQYNQGSSQIAHSLQNIEIPQWILSGDKMMQTISTSYQIGILTRKQNLLRIDEIDEEKLKL
jgi:hypothetical protein